MDERERDVESQANRNPVEEALRATPLFTMIGCPDWCSWSVSQPTHTHVSDGLAEVVLDVSPWRSEEVVLEVRHVAAPATPKSG